MPGDSTLVVTTKSGVRPLGVRGEPLHNAAPQLRRVIRRRLGDAAADLLADPQPHEDGKAIDWHAGWPGAVRPVNELEPARRTEILAEVERTLAEIRRLGDTLASSGCVPIATPCVREPKSDALAPLAPHAFVATTK